MKNVIDVQGLSHQFGAVQALNNLTYTVEEGEVFGVLGPNGAGKTTSIRILNGLLTPTQGTVRLFGLDPASQGSQVRLRTGVLTETPSLYERLTARDNLLTIGGLYGVPAEALPGRVEATLEQFGLSSRADDRVGGYSRGMKQRLALARAFLHEPQILFLDEPTSSLDPEAAHQVTGLIEQLSHQAGRTVFLCTHNLDEAQRLCDRVLVLNQGQTLAVGTQEELGRTLWQTTWVDIRLEQPLAPGVVPSLGRLPFVHKVQSDALELSIQVEKPGQVPDLVEELVAQGARLMQVSPRKHTLEDIYFALQEGGQPA